MQAYSPLATMNLRPLFVVTLAMVNVCLPVLQAQVKILPAVGNPPVAPEPKADEEVRSLGIFVTQERLSRVTANGMMAIPKGALVSVVEAASGQKYAVFRMVRLPISDLAQLSKDPSLIAAATAQSTGASANALPGAPMVATSNIAPQATSQEQIRLDASGKVISRSKTTVVSDGTGNTTTIQQGALGGMTPEMAGRLAAARQKIQQQKQAIFDLQLRRQQKAAISGYESKMKEMTDLLARMEVELAKMEVIANQ